MSDDTLLKVEDLKVHFGKKDESDDGLSYTPVIALFSVAALTAIAFTWYAFETLFTWQTLGWFISISMILLVLILRILSTSGLPSDASRL